MAEVEQETLDDLDLDVLAKRVEQARRHVAAIKRLFPGLVTFTEEERETLASIEDEKEADAIEAVLRVMDVAPQKFEDVWDPMTWEEPEDFTAEIGRDLLSRWRALRKLERELAELSRDLTDHTLYLGELVRGPIAQSAADVALDLAATNGVVRRALGKAYNYWLRHAPKRWLRRMGRERRSK